MNSLLTLQDFSYSYPQELVAQSPLERRDQSKLLVRSPDGNLSHSLFSELHQHLPQGALLILNDTRVFASRLFAYLPCKTKIEVFLLDKPKEDQTHSFTLPCFLRPAKKVSVDSVLHFSEDCKARVAYKAPQGEHAPILLEFESSMPSFSTWLQEHAFVPLPPYIKRQDAVPWKFSKDSERYQTVYAHEEGSVAAPTAGLHFTPEVLDALTRKDITCAPITLHVGPGTFLPVRVENPVDHAMHTERFFVPTSTWRQIQKARSEDRPILAVGTTSFRCMESFMRFENQGKTTDTWHETQLFIYPQTRTDLYKSSLFTGMITNFHQPCSTLFMLVCALLGWEQAQKLYAEAVDRKYRLFSYGDSSLLYF